jgi:hypothetical protein
MSDVIFEPLIVNEQELVKEKEFQDYLDSLRNQMIVGLAISKSVREQSRMEGLRIQTETSLFWRNFQT